MGEKSDGAVAATAARAAAFEKIVSPISCECTIWAAVAAGVAVAIVQLLLLLLLQLMSTTHNNNCDYHYY